MSLRRPWAIPLVPLYWAGLRGKDALRRAGLPSTRNLRWPVISVGSVSAGGAGKTPVVIALANLLHAHGHTVNVLSRGYGRPQRALTREPSRVDVTLPDAAARFGDEPVLIARSVADVDVWVSADRHGAGLAAQQVTRQASGIHLLDDGFQHRSLARALDIVLITAEDLEDALLPAGNLREPLSALSRADILVLREEERASITPQVERWFRSGTSIWTIRRTLEAPAGLDGVLAFAGIARPEGFFHMLRSSGLRVIDSVPFADHHRYVAADMRRLARRMQSQEGG